jgi:hypothetical protein
MVNRMTQFANIQLPDNRILDPMLDELVRKLALDNSNWIFSWKRHDQWNYNNAMGNKRNADGDLITAPDGKQFLRRVNVIAGGEQLGTISVSHRYGRKNTDTYDIESWRIEKQRGSRHVTSTEKLDIAVRKIKKLFVKMDYAEIMNKADTAIRTGMYTSLRELKNPIDRSSLIKDEVMLQKYVFCEVRGLPMPDSIKRPIRELFESPKYEEHMSQYELAVETELMFSRGQMTSVAVHNGLYLYKDANTDELHAVEFDQMSEAWQNRIAVLQLMADHEVVRDVGYRYNDTNFYIVI